MVLYRCEAKGEGYVDEWENWVSVGYSIRTLEYEVIKETPKGYWIEGLFGHNDFNNIKKWVSKTTRKRYAYDTKEGALHGFEKRILRRMSILRSQLDMCSNILEVINGAQHNGAEAV